MNTGLIVRALSARRSGQGWMAKCPAHDDKNPSLSIRDVEGKTLLHCHGGCAQRDVIDALSGLGVWQPTTQRKPAIVATYSYTDEKGSLLYQVVRYEPKDFRQRRPDGREGWTWKRGERQVLYRLPEVLEAPIVFVVEGERDVESLREYGFAATTNAGGAKSPWMPQYTDALRGREVILIPDNDVPGRKHMFNVARALVGKVAKLVVLELEGGSKDVTEWFHQGHSELELIELLDGEEVSR